ncbi:MAG: Na+/H+ antiporter subunit E [Defluviitaleaceae bacterium]|nr:Na+/H+ antiporter subunit E [Defluviitaleaceae bacterium]
MGKHGFFILVALAVIWLILAETVSWMSLAMGLLIAAFVVFFSDKFLPRVTKATTVRFSKLIFYPFYLLGQVYLAGFSMLKFVITGAKVDLVPVKTTLKSEPLKVLLMDSMTFVPGSISLDIEDDTITMLWFYDKKIDKDKLSNDEIGRLLKTGLEKRLLKAEIPEDEIIVLNVREGEE